MLQDTISKGVFNTPSESAIGALVPECILVLRPKVAPSCGEGLFNNSTECVSGYLLHRIETWSARFANLLFEQALNDGLEPEAQSLESGLFAVEFAASDLDLVVTVVAARVQFIQGVG